MISSNLNPIKIVCEIAAYGFAAVFLATKFVGGQANAGMEVSLELIRREALEPNVDNLAILVHRAWVKVTRWASTQPIFDAAACGRDREAALNSGNGHSGRGRSNDSS